MLPRILACVVDWVRAHRQFSVKFSTHVSATWVYIKTWKTGEFVRVAVAIIDQYYGDANGGLAISGNILSAVGSGASLVSLSGGSHTPIECYRDCLGSGYTKTLVDYSIFDVRPLKRCLQKTASVVFGTLDPFSMTEFIVTRLRGRNIETGCNRGSLYEWPLKQAISLLPACWMLSVTSSVFRRSSCHF